MTLEDITRGIPIELQNSEVIKKLLSLSQQYTQLYGEVSNVDLNSTSLPVKTKIGVAILEFINLVSGSSTDKEKAYILRRLLSEKSALAVLKEIEDYLTIEFDRSVDPSTGLPKTYYTPKLLKVTIESLTLTSFNMDFVKIIRDMFDNLLYFLNYDMSINNIIFDIRLQVKDVTTVINSTPIKYVLINI